MSIKYFCDVCNQEVQTENKATLMGSIGWNSKIFTICKTCWLAAEKSLLETHSEIIPKTIS